MIQSCKHLFISLLLLIIGCSPKQPKTIEKVKADSSYFKTEAYELSIPVKQEHLLILFPCFPCDAANTKTEFTIEELALKNNIAVLYLNFNLHLWLSEKDKGELENLLISVIEQHNLNYKNTFIGGFSGGGNVSLLLTNYLKSKDSKIKPHGVFIVDSPIDLHGLYANAKRTIEKNISKVAVQEANWIIDLFDKEFGLGDSSFVNYENRSPYVLKTHVLKNVSQLNDVKIRFYSEPDTLWWKENRQSTYEEMNAYYIEQLAKDLLHLYGKDNVEYITTKNKGYRSNGERHPHSWSIVDQEYLIDWILSSKPSNTK